MAHRKIAGRLPKAEDILSGKVKDTCSNAWLQQC
jgi:hypothetical protein